MRKFVVTLLAAALAISGISQSSAAPKVKVDPLVQSAYTAYDHASCAKKTHPNFVATYRISPSYSAGMASQQKLLFEKAMACYNSYFKAPVQINVVLLNENEYEYLASLAINGQPMFEATYLGWAKGMMSRVASGAGGFAGSAGWNAVTNSAWVLMIDSTKSTSPDAHGAGHEFVHILQSYSRSNNFKYFGEGSTPADYVNLPPWFWEGTAELFSTASISPSAGIFSTNMRTVRYQAKESPSLKVITDSATLLSRIQLIEAPSNQEANMMHYALGSVYCEYILGKYGYKKYMELMQGAATYLDFNENLKMTLGVSKADFYSQASSFVLAQWATNKF